jgi:uncharacterized protein YdiU (UPF0061 family)
MPDTALPPRFDNSYSRLPERFHVRLAPEPVSGPRLLRINRPLAEELGLGALADDPERAAEVFSGNRLPEGAEPIAAAYAGHQFGNFVPQLGDGRAILLGEVIDAHGRRRDIQLKGSGRTPFSRMGDGRAALGPVLREYLVSEAMHALGIPTTRSLAAVATGEPVYRETVLPGAVLTRVAASHIRVGTFQFFAARGDTEALRLLADHAIARHHPEAAEAPRPALGLLEAVAERQAALVAAWLHVGFVHGVMNTDNMAISGETIDYGPCAFMDAHDAATVFSSIDQTGRYAYANQPRIAQWNLARFAETLLPLIEDDPEAALEPARAVIDGFAGRFQQHWLAGMRRKIGLATAEEGDRDLVLDLLEAMQEGAADHTATFRALAEAAEGRDGPARALFAEPARFDAWAADWRARLAREPAEEDLPGRRAAGMRAVNPAIVPRNMAVEAALAAAAEEGDLGPFERLLGLLAKPFEDRPEAADLARPPGPEARGYRTFCGT